MKSMLYSVLAMTLLLQASCTQHEPSQPAAAQTPSQEYVEAERIPPNAMPEQPIPTPDTSAQQLPYRDGAVRTNGKGVEVVDATGNVIASNEHIIREPDEDSNCPSNGFRRLVAKGDFFTIEQQTCGGMFFNDEYITFKAAADGKIYLHKFSIAKTSREDPEAHIPQRDLTTKDFGRIELTDVELQTLYERL